MLLITRQADVGVTRCPYPPERGESCDQATDERHSELQDGQRLQEDGLVRENQLGVRNGDLLKALDVDVAPLQGLLQKCNCKPAIVDMQSCLLPACLAICSVILHPLLGAPSQHFQLPASAHGTGASACEGCKLHWWPSLAAAHNRFLACSALLLHVRLSHTAWQHVTPISLHRERSPAGILGS
jgi:hypothetical protein